MIQKFIIKLNNTYYVGESTEPSKAAIHSGGWYCERKELNSLLFLKDRSKALVIEGLFNLNSHWNRIYNAMRYDSLKAEKIEIISISEKENTQNGF